MNMTDADTTERITTDAEDAEPAAEAVEPPAPKADLEERLVAEGEIAGDYLEELLDLLDFDGDIDLDVDGDRAHARCYLLDFLTRDGKTELLSPGEYECELRNRDGATIDPYRACLGLAEAAEKRGAKIFEKSPVKRVTFNRKIADVYTAGGKIRTRKVIVATGTPTMLYKSLRRHFWFRTAYLALTDKVPAKIRKQLGKRKTVVRDSAEPYHVVRWLDGRHPETLSR